MHPHCQLPWRHSPSSELSLLELSLLALSLLELSLLLVSIAESLVSPLPAHAQIMPQLTPSLQCARAGPRALQGNNTH